MGYKLIYIDDDFEEAKILRDGLITNQLLEIEVQKADNFEQQLKEIIKQQKHFDGIILDLKLDENQEGDKKAFYTAPAFAQQLRSKSSNESPDFKNEFPIFLLTSKIKLSQYYNSDKASHDLFDSCFIKSKNFGTSAKSYENEIFSIISAYEKIEKSSSYEEILDLTIDTDLKYSVFTDSYEESSVSEKAKFINKQIIGKSGVLINEKILAARLGIDIENSADWSALKEKLEKIKYTGVYSDIHEKTTVSKRNLAALNASERVNFLKDVFKVKELNDAKPIPKTVSTRYWTICQALQKPLDPNEGFKLRNSHPESWQDTEYITLQSFLDGKVQPKDIHPIEIERFKYIKSQFTK